jgi:hypothetical protein
VRDREVDEEAKFVRECWKRWSLKVSKFQILGDTGYPDRVVWFPGGKPIFIEFKREGYEPELKQAEIHAELTRLGYLVETHTNADRALQSIASAVEATQLPKASREVPTGARSRRSVLGSRSR